MRIERKKTLLLLSVLFAAALMIGVPLSAASTSTPAYLASGSTMNYVTSTSGYTDYQTYTSGAISSTTTNNVTSTPATYYYNVTVSSSNSTAVDITVPTYGGMTSYTNMPISEAKYMVPIDVKSTSKNVTISLSGLCGYYSGNSNTTLNYTKMVKLQYYKSAFGSVQADKYTIDTHTIISKATSSTAASYENVTGTLYVSPVTNLIVGSTLNYYDKYVKSGTTAANETYTITSSTQSLELTSTNVVPITTDYTGAYIGIAVAAVLLGVAVYYFYMRKEKHEEPKQPEKEAPKENEDKTNKQKPKE